MKSFINKLTEEINKSFCFGQVEKNMLLTEATFLDSRFKKYVFKNPIAFHEAKKSIINKRKTIISEKQSNLSTYLIPPIVNNNTNKEDLIWKSLT